MEAEKRARIRRIADERFAWAEMARRSMGRNWAKLSDAQKQEFVPLFTSLVYQAYMDKVADYKGEKIVYGGEQTEEGYSTVSVAIITEKNTETPVSYRMTKDDETVACLRRLHRGREPREQLSDAVQRVPDERHD